MHYDSKALTWEPFPSDVTWERTTVKLTENDTAWNPASTKHVIYGPAEVTYERGPGGGVSAFVDA
jgi:hypothetical protein